MFYRADGSARTVREVYDWALKQPNGGDVAAAAKSAAPRFNTPPSSVSGTDLLGSALAWSPRRPSFSALADDGEASLPVTPFLLTPGVMEILSQVSPRHG